MVQGCDDVFSTCMDAGGGRSQDGTIACVAKQQPVMRRRPVETPDWQGECVWQHVFADFEEARRAIREWIRWYNEERPHQSLNYRSPAQHRAQQLELVA
jgi:transposase InsO family protein